MTKIIFIGLSNKINESPLSSNTISGKLIDGIISNLNFQCIKANLVDFAPLNTDGKLRYPNKNEMDEGLKSLKIILDNNRPYIAVCLGDKVSKFLNDKIDNKISIKHPAYVAVYKRKDAADYINNTIDNINCIISNKNSKKLLQKDNR